MDLKIILTLCLCALTVAQDVAPNQSINKPEIVQINPAHDDVSLQSFSNSPSTGLPNTQKDFNAFIQFAQNQQNPYLSPYMINNPYQFQQQQQPQLQQQQQLQYLQQFQTPQKPLLQASLQSSLPSFLYQNFINKPLNFFKPQQQQQQPPQFPNYPTGLIQSPQFPNYPSGLIQSPQFFPTSSSLQSQYVPNYHQQPQLVSSSNQYYPQFSSNPYQNVLPTQNTYYPQTSSQYPQFNQQVSTINYPQIPNNVPAVNPGNSGYQFIQPNPSYVQPSIPYAPYIPHGQVQYSQQLQTPFLVDLARYIYGK